MDFLYLRFEYVITFPSACCNISVVFGSLNKYAALRVTQDNSPNESISYFVYIVVLLIVH